MSEAFKKDSGGYVAAEKVYLTRDGKVVLEGDHRAVQLLASKGGRVSEKLGKRLGLDKARIEPLDDKQPAHGFVLKSHGGFASKPAENHRPRNNLRTFDAPGTPTV